VLEAIGLGAFAQITLLLSGLLVFWVVIPPRYIGWLAGFGAGAMISAVAVDLTNEADALGGLGARGLVPARRSRVSVRRPMGGIPVRL